MNQEVTPPAWIADLPVDHRGFPVPAEAGWTEDGLPRISVVATDRKVALALRRACAICGHLMPKGELVFRAFAQSDAAQVRGYERESSQDLAGPLHRSCVLYSAIVCPYLRERNARLGKDNIVNPGARRGTLAAVMGFRDMSLLLFAGPHEFLSPDAPVPHIGYLGLSEDIKYRDGSELVERYNEAVKQDSKVIDPSAPRAYWRTSDDLQALGAELHDAFRSLNTRTADYNMVLSPNTPYVGFYV